jgi:hypothetical protein
VNVQATAKNSFTLASLTLQVYVANPSDLRQVANVTVAENVAMLSGGQINQDIQVIVPSDAQRTSLIARLSESIEMNTFIVYNNAALQPAPDYTPTSDDAVAPLTYIMAATPDYSVLLSQFQALQSKLSKMQQNVNQTQSTISQENATISQQNSNIQQLSGQLAYANRRVQTYQGLSVALGFVSVAFAIAYVYRRTSRQSEIEPTVQRIPVANPQQLAQTLKAKPKRKLSLKLSLKKIKIPSTKEEFSRGSEENSTNRNSALS